MVKQILLSFFALTVINCKTTRFIDSWKSNDTEHFQVDKILVIAITSNVSARQKFEEQLAKEYQLRGLDAVASYTQLSDMFASSLKTETELKKIEDKLIALGFDSILLTKIIGVKYNVRLAEAYRNLENTYRNFSAEYYINQHIYHDVRHYEKYKIYRGETQLYCICPTKKRSLIWMGHVNIFTPASTNKTIKSYIKQIVSALENDHLL
jgi:hypothetical protein